MKKLTFNSMYRRAIQSNGRLFITPRTAARARALHPWNSRYGAAFVSGVQGGIRQAITVREFVRLVTFRNPTRAC